jgi:hypothetical protein
MHAALKLVEGMRREGAWNLRGHLGRMDDQDIGFVH